MSVDAADIVVLDAHGVVFNRVLPTFVRCRAAERGEDPDATWQRWRTDLRLDFWEGRIGPPEMWDRLFPGDNPAELSARLERSYRPGPWFDFVATGSQRLWLLSNHRTGWLLPRLSTFGIAERFERVLVSDRLGVAKPDRRAFAAIVEAARTAAVCLVDDSPQNVAVAAELGLDARLADRRPDAMVGAFVEVARR